MKNQGVSQRGMSLALSLPVHERNKVVLLLCINKQHIHVSTNEYLPHRQTCPVTQSVPTLTLTMCQYLVNIGLKI